MSGPKSGLNKYIPNTPASLPISLLSLTIGPQHTLSSSFPSP